mgnify:CR=1 FL=1
MKTLFNTLKLKSPDEVQAVSHRRMPMWKRQGKSASCLQMLWAVQRKGGRTTQLMQTILRPENTCVLQYKKKMDGGA